MPIMRWDELQLKFDLPDLDEAEDDAIERAITPEEARLISEAARGTLEAQGGTILGKKPDWMGDYMLLREQGWPWRVASYIAWASSPKIGRWPKTLGELARDVLGLKSPRVIYRWRQKYQSIETVVSMMQARSLWEHRVDVFKALVDMATDPNYKAHNDRKLFLEMTGDYVPRSMLGLGKAGKGGELVEMSEEELRRWARGGEDGKEILRSVWGDNNCAQNDIEKEEEIASQSALAMTEEEIASQSALAMTEEEIASQSALAMTEEGDGAGD